MCPIKALLNTFGATLYWYSTHLSAANSMINVLCVNQKAEIQACSSSWCVELIQAYQLFWIIHTCLYASMWCLSFLMKYRKFAIILWWNFTEQLSKPAKKLKRYLVCSNSVSCALAPFGLMENEQSWYGLQTTGAKYMLHWTMSSVF